MITARDWAKADYLVSHLTDADKRLILKVQNYAELMKAYPQHPTAKKRIEDYLTLLATRLKVSRNVADALSCFAVTP
jgi:uncharacterized protein (DUF2236 family)